jgi:hypothetical protein
MYRDGTVLIVAKVKARNKKDQAVITQSIQK